MYVYVYFYVYIYIYVYYVDVQLCVCVIRTRIYTYKYIYYYIYIYIYMCARICVYENICMYLYVLRGHMRPCLKAIVDLCRIPRCRLSGELERATNETA